MLIRSLSLVLAIISYCSVFAKTETVLLRIDGQPTSLGEFEYYLRHTGKTSSPEQFFNHFLNFKLKIADAKRMRLDTLPDFLAQYRLIEAELLKPATVDKEKEELFYRELYRCHKKRFARQEQVKLKDITLRIAQHATEKEFNKTKHTADSLYAVLQHGECSFEQMASSYSVIPDTWLPLSELTDETIRQLAELKKGEYSKPFYSPIGIHIVMLEDKKTEAEFNDVLPSLKTYAERLSIKAPYLNHTACKTWMNGNKNNLLLQMAYEGLLAVYWDSYTQPKPLTSPTEKELKEYFSRHKSDYQWELPHFRGAVVHCRNKKSASKIRKFLKKIPQNEWIKAAKHLADMNPELDSKIETGLFRIGKNPYIDRLAFKCGETTPDTAFPYTFILGKRLKKGAKEYTDVLETVTKDYMQAQKEENLTVLKQLFKVEINQDVLKTVNCCGNK